MRDLPALWSSPAWRAEALAWIDDQLDVVGPIAQERVRFWSVMLAVPTRAGLVWFKANAPSQAFEAGLVETCAQVAPARVPPVLAVDRERGWLVTADCGPTLHARLGDDVPAETLADVLADIGYAWSALQRRLVGAESAMRAARVPAFDDGNALAYAVALADDLAGLPSEDPRRLEGARLPQVEEGLGRVGAAAARLEVTGIPDSLDHNDLHVNNVVRRGAGLAFLDLADALWAHPFASVRMLTWRARETGDPGIERAVVDAVIDPWDDLAPSSDLAAAVTAAERIGCLHRAQSWRRLMADVPVDVLAEHAQAPARWLLAACAPDPYAALSP